MNVYDSVRMADALADGFMESSSAEEADLIILNTCHIRERASEKIFSELGRLAQVKKQKAAQGQAMLIAVAGCVAQAEGSEIVRRQPAVDLVVGPQAYHRLPDLISKAESAPGLVDTSFPLEDKLDHIPPAPAAKTRQRGVTAFVTVQEGCDKFCAFCVVPYTRGAEISRKPARIIDEIRRLAEAGVRDVTLLGQNVNAYRGVDGGGLERSLAWLLERVASIPGIARIRYATSHPADMSDDLIEAHRSLPMVMPFLHLPAQSGSDRILRAMNRRHTSRDYLRILEKIRAARHDIALSSDFIVGFPGESDADFRATLALVREVGFAQAYSFKYSPRPGTPAADAPDQIAEPLMKERLAELQAEIEAGRRAFNQTALGSVQEVLFEKPGRHAGQLAGKTPYMQAVHAEAEERLIGTVQPVKIIESGPNSFGGRIIQRSGSEL